MKRRVTLRAGLLLGLIGGVGAAGAIINCASTEDESVSIATGCDPGALSASDPAEVTVRLYGETASELLKRAEALETKFKDVCNKMNRDLGDAEGANVRAACNKIATRLAAAQALAPVPDGGVAPFWVIIRFDDQFTGCAADTQAEAACINQCGGGEGGACSATASCEPKGAVFGTCPAACSGTCRTAGPSVPCVGECRGNCTAPGGGVEAGVPACGGECVGACTAATWTGRCEGGCTAGFVGKCLGECSGNCSGSPVGFPAPVDAGPDAEAGVDAGPIGPTGPENCKATCAGRCSAMASGSCTARCNGAFAGGTCAGAGNCTGTCVAATTACTTTCNGYCFAASSTLDSGTCTGECQGQDSCSTPLTASTCEGTAACVGNAECSRVCRARGALAKTCAPVAAPEIRLAGDFLLYTALRNHIAEFIQLVAELELLRNGSDGMAQRTLANFRAIGIRSDNARNCVESAGPMVAQARTTLQLSFDATQILKGKAF